MGYEGSHTLENTVSKYNYKNQSHFVCNIVRILYLQSSLRNEVM